MLKERIATFIREQGAPAAGAALSNAGADADASAVAANGATFESLALEAFAWQFERIEPLRALCRQRGVEPDSVAHWQQLPAIPAAAFRSLTLAAEPAVEHFRSSGTMSVQQDSTTAGGAPEGGDRETGRSVHHHPFPDLYRQTLDVAFPRHCLDLRPLPMLSLIGDRAQLPDSSLAFMVDHVLRRFGDDKSRYAFGPRGVDFPAARSWLSARQRAGRPVLILATAFALAQLLERLDKLGLRFRLPAGSALFETGGFKGRARAVDAAALAAATTAALGIEPGRILREYGMTELTSQFYTEALSGGDPHRFVASPWTRVRILDPETLAEAPAGSPGLIAVFDLANLGSAVHLLTEDLGVADADRFRLLGRADGAQLRGCSLTVEALSS